MQDQSFDGATFCPSFSSYSTDLLADVAARVGLEEHNADAAAATSPSALPLPPPNYDEEDDFEFVLVRADDSGATGGDEFQVFPLFNRDLLLDRGGFERLPEDQVRFNNEVEERIMFPLKQLFLEDRDPPSSSSSSEADELEAIPPGTYCVWTPRTSPSPSPSPTPGRCKKSNSTGSSSPKPRWRLRDLLKRSSSDGKNSLFFLNQSGSVSSSSSNDSSSPAKKKADKGKATTTAAAAKVSAHEAFYVRNKAMKEGDKRKSYLPYRQDLVGFFANANLGRSFPPF